MSEHITEIEKLMEAKRIIEKMTENRFKYDQRSSYIDSETDQFIAIQMKSEAALDGEYNNIRFEAELKEAGKPLNPEQLLRLVFESSVAYALVNKLAEMEYNPTPQNLEDFNEFVHQQEESTQTDGFIMNQQM